MKRAMPKLKSLLPTRRRGNDGDMDEPGGGAFRYDPMAEMKSAVAARNRRAWLAVGTAYFLTIAAAGGVIFYLESNKDTILAEMADLNPMVVVREFPLVSNGGHTASATHTGDSGTDADGGAMMADAGSDAHGSDGEDAGEVGSMAQEIDRAATPLPTHPDPSLVEDGDIGPLPIIGPNGRKPWRVYSKPYNPLETRPRISIVVTGLGLSRKVTEDAAALSGHVTLAFAPYARNLDEYVDLARGNGHEVLLTLPMEPRDFPRSDPGPYALMTTEEADTNLGRLRWVMSRATGYIGLAGQQGSAFAADREALQPIMIEMASRGLAFLDIKADPNGTAADIAELAGVPVAEVDIVADQTLSRADILRSLSQAELLAKAKGSAVVLLHAYPAGLQRVESWAADLPDRGFVLAPLSSVIDMRRHSG